MSSALPSDDTTIFPSEPSSEPTQMDIQTTVAHTHKNVSLPSLWASRVLGGLGEQRAFEQRATIFPSDPAWTQTHTPQSHTNNTHTYIREIKLLLQYSLPP
jgi:hypothetical protein